MTEPSAIPERGGSIYNGNALKLLPGLPPGSVRLLLTDPPYNVGRKNNLQTIGRAGFDFEWDGGFDQISWLALAAPAIMPGGSIVVWNDWKNLGMVAFALQKLGFDPKRPLTWRKTNPFPRNRERSFIQGQEFGLWATKGESWVFNRRLHLGYERGEFAYPIQRSEHPAKKPTLLFKEIIEILTNPGDLVLDPFAGEGTTACAAEMCGRRHISFELDPKWHQAAITALKATREDLPEDPAPVAKPRPKRNRKSEAVNGPPVAEQ